MNKIWHWLNRWLGGEVGRIEGYVVIAILIGFLVFLFLKLAKLDVAITALENILGK